ncbi:MAG: YiiX/YebB-like N1pC/P60 family cysteine hydrolase [Pirellulaceae bacterium]
MNCLILAVVALGSTPTVADGSIVYLQKSNGFVEFYTGSDQTHVGIVFSDASQQWVYEAAPGKVRRVPLADYLRNLGELNRRRSEEIGVYFRQPRRSFSPAEVYAMRHYLDMQLGKPYTVRNFIGNVNTVGFHCSELVGEGLNRSRRFKLGQPQALSPAQLLRLTQSQYQPSRQVSVVAAGRERPWCQRTWGAWADFGNWCRWSCGESWNFFR